MQITRTFSLNTCCFAHGAYQTQNRNIPEIRVPSIRGQLRWWYDALNPQPSFQKSRTSDELFGNIGKTAKAGSLIIRLQETENCDVLSSAAFMPHKGHRGGQKNAIAAQSAYKLIIRSKRTPLTTEQLRRLEHCLDTWMLLGSIGQRANRAAGSIQPTKKYSSIEEAQHDIDTCLSGSKIKAVIHPSVFKSEEDLRSVAGDFLADKAFAADRTPFGSARPRKPSLLKIKAILVDGNLHPIIIWDGRSQPISTLQSAARKLAANKDIGRIIQQVLEQLQ